MKTIRISFLLIICLFTTLQLSAQTASLSGRVTDADTNEALARATVQLYRIGKDTICRRLLLQCTRSVHAQWRSRVVYATYLISWLQACRATHQTDSRTDKGAWQNITEAKCHAIERDGSDGQRTEDGCQGRYRRIQCRCLPSS